MKGKLLAVGLCSLFLTGCCCCGGVDSPSTSSSNRSVSITPTRTPTTETLAPETSAADETLVADETPEEKAAKVEREKAKAEADAKRERLAAEARAERERLAAEATATEESEGKETQARLMALKFVRKHLKFPDNADFHMFGTSAGKTVEIFGKRHWVIKGKVDARNAFGADLTHSYTAQIFYHDGTWYPRAIQIGDEQQFFMPDELVQAVYAPEMVLAAAEESSGSGTSDRPRRPPPQPKTFEARTWHSGESTVDASFVKFGAGKVTIKRSDNGKEVTVPLARLSDEDQAYVKSLR